MAGLRCTYKPRVNRFLRFSSSNFYSFIIRLEPCRVDKDTVNNWMEDAKNCQGPRPELEKVLDTVAYSIDYIG